MIESRREQYMNGSVLKEELHLAEMLQMLREVREVIPGFKAIPGRVFKVEQGID